MKVLVFFSTRIPNTRRMRGPRESIRAMTECWRRLESSSCKVRLVDTSAPVASWILDAMEADFIVLPFPDDELFHLIRHRLRLSARLVIGGDGEGQNACTWLFRKTGKPGLFRGDLWIAPCHAEKRALLKCFPRARVEVIPFPFVREQPAVLPAERTPALLFAGRFTAPRELHTLLSAVALLKKSRPRIVLHMIGGPDPRSKTGLGIPSSRYKKYLERLARDLGVEKNIRWHGWLSADQTYHLQTSIRHVYCNPGIVWSDYFPLATFHSLCTGQPAAFSAWGGALDLKTAFPRRAFPCPIRRTQWGAVLSPWDFAQTLGKALDSARASRPRTPRQYSSSAVTAKLRRLLARAYRERAPADRSPLRAAASLRKIPPPGRPYGWRFRGYDDLLSFPFQECYGMPRSQRPYPRAGALAIPPWVRIFPGDPIEIEVLDPRRGLRKTRLHRGSHQLRAINDISGKSLSVPEPLVRWLWENGCAFELGQK